MTDADPRTPTGPGDRVEAQGIPARGVPREELFARMETFRDGDLDTKGGRTWAYVYDPGRPDIDEVAKKALVDWYDENSLDPTVYPSLLRFENEVVGMARAHLRGDEKVVGNFTSGGTESCMMAVKSARDHHRFLHGDERARGGRRLNLVLPVTAHPAFHKGARYFDLELRTVPVDTKSWKADPCAMADAIDDHTVMIVGSAVSYAHGVVDPISELAQVALDREVLFHVDGCIGGFVLPYFRRLGEPVTDFDFAVPGVTSMSMDFHKYGYCPKGASVVLYSDASIRRHQLFAASAWTGYTVINTTFQSTKSGGPLAATWAVLNYVGDEGFMEIFRRTRDARDAIIDGVAGIDELEVMGDPEASLVAVTATTDDGPSGSEDRVNVFDVCDRMRERRWFVQPQLGFAGSKANIHLSVGGSSLPLVPELIADLGDAVAEAKASPTPPPEVGIVELLHSIDPAELDDDTFDLLLAGGGLDARGVEGGPEVPSETAAINGLLQACPTPLAEKLLVEYFNRLYVP